ncbi:MAG TPA: alpha/beta fold hydrolase [Solirubrobacteraceae bacterium]|nr:alpha/beta fold hydrolase [Solirubrobacteraceae bacterium]
MSSHPTGAVTVPDDPLALAPAQGAFADRREAGRRLAALLGRFRAERPIVVGMPRGGVPVAAEVARALQAPLEVALVRKIGAPRNREYAIGAVAEGGVCLLDRASVHALGLSERGAQRLVQRAEHELAEQAARYRGAREPLSLAGRTAILVDDGLATGRSAQAAIHSLRRRGAARVILAVPVAAPESAHELRGEADEVVCALAPEGMWAVGLWYEDFRPVGDEQVTALLEAAHERTRSAPGDGVSPDGAGEVDREVEIVAAGAVALGGELTLPADPEGMVVFAHGSGSSRLSPRNRRVARALNAGGYGTLLFDLLTVSEERRRANVFDVPLLASRLLAAAAWLDGQEQCAQLPLACFGASTGAAAALTAAAEQPQRVRAVISRGGRPDLAERLSAVRAPTLLIVGGADTEVLALNELARAQLRCASELAVVPGATHLFEEPGALEQVSGLALDWLARHCRAEP